jgi:Domain of unknown function (DUF3850)
VGSRMTEHEIKSWPPYFSAVKAGEKVDETRKNDRDYRVGDVLVLREFVSRGTGPDGHTVGEYTDRQPIRRLVTRVTDLGPWGAPGHVHMLMSPERPGRRPESP